MQFTGNVRRSIMIINTLPISPDGIEIGKYIKLIALKIPKSTI